MIFLQGNKFTREKQMDIWFLNSIQSSGHISYPISSFICALLWSAIRLCHFLHSIHPIYLRDNL